MSDAQTATFTFPSASLRPAPTGSTSRYSGKINTQANGLFALDYKNKEGKDARSLFTQFEAGRRPALRAELGRARLQGDLGPDGASCPPTKWR